jgi:hypothetical protein
MGEAETRVGINESIFRKVNERIEELSDDLNAPQAEFVCECADPACAERFSLSRFEYEAVRDHPDRFALVAGHYRPRFERIVEEHDCYLVVEKVDEAGEIAKATDPRSD